MDRLPHGYTNLTRRLPNGLIEKTYDGPWRWGNARREIACLDALRPFLPVPRIVDRDDSVPRLTLTALPGTHGQDLLDAGHAPRVLTLVGHALSTLQRIPVDAVPNLDGEGTVIVHGDFGPQNMLFDLEGGTVTGVLDWESAHAGSPIEDLAWAEWLVRMHHPDSIDALDSLFSAAAVTASWPERHGEMISRVEALATLCAAAGMTEAAAVWRDRLVRTAAFCE